MDNKIKAIYILCKTMCAYIEALELYKDLPLHDEGVEKLMHESMEYIKKMSERIINGK